MDEEGLYIPVWHSEATAGVQGHQGSNDLASRMNVEIWNTGQVFNTGPDAPLSDLPSTSHYIFLLGHNNNGTTCPLPFPVFFYPSQCPPRTGQHAPCSYLMPPQDKYPQGAPTSSIQQSGRRPTEVDHQHLLITLHQNPICTYL